MNRFTTDLGPVLTSRALRVRAGEKSYARGEQYFRDQRVILGLISETLEVCENLIRKLKFSDETLEAGLRELAALHHQACVVARPNAPALAQTLFDWEVSCERPLFTDAARTYRDALGPRGLAVYRALAATMHEALCPHHTTSLEFRRVAHIRATLALLDF